jgi:hypothetical protein
MLAPPPRWWSVLGVLLLPALATGTEVEVGYLVARTPVVQRAADGTPITFTLHSDAECSGPAVRTVVSRLTDVVIHDVLREAPGMPARQRLNAVRLVAKVQDMDPDTAPFVRVTGPGILPAGVACQMWYSAGRGTVHSTASELRERMVPAGAARARPYGATATPDTGATEKGGPSGPAR